VNKLLAQLLCVLFCLPAFAQVSIPAGANQSTIQSTISNAAVGSVVNFPPRLDVTAPITLKCGVTYSGPVGNPAVLNSTFGQGGSIFRINASNCGQPTTIQYLKFANSGGLYVQTPFDNLHLLHNQFGNLPCCNGGASNVAVWIESVNTSSNTAAMLTNAVFDWNQFGDSASCISPQNGMTNHNSPEDSQVGACNGIVVYSSVDGWQITNNTFFHVAEGVHINCPNYGHQRYPCEPPGGAVHRNITVRYNDFNQIHRISWEQQAQQVSGEDWEFNSEHDWFQPYFGSFGISMACCYNGTSAPFMNVSNNTVIFNTSASPGRYGYGMEAAGHLATYDHILLQAAHSSGSASGLAYGCGPVGSMSNNTVQGGFGNEYIINENYGFPCGTDRTPARFTGNVTGPNVAAVTSVAPSISPASGNYSGLVTITDAGYLSGPQPLGNTSIYFTTDGSTPTVNSSLYTGPFNVAGNTTVKAIGMWGTGANTRSYAQGYGFVPSPMVSASYSGSGSPIPPPVVPDVPVVPVVPVAPTLGNLTGAYLHSTDNKLIIGKALAFTTIGKYSAGPDTPIANGAILWTSNNPAVLAVDQAGVATAIAAGVANVQARIGSTYSSPWTVTVSAPAVTMFPVTQTLAPGTYTLTVGPTGVVTVSQ
jgi:hypothetical protein